MKVIDKRGIDEQGKPGPNSFIFFRKDAMARNKGSNLILKSWIQAKVAVIFFLFGYLFEYRFGSSY